MASISIVPPSARLKNTRQSPTRRRSAVRAFTRLTSPATVSAYRSIPPTMRARVGGSIRRRSRRARAENKTGTSGNPSTIADPSGWADHPAVTGRNLTSSACMRGFSKEQRRVPTLSRHCRHRSLRQSTAKCTAKADRFSVASTLAGPRLPCPKWCLRCYGNDPIRGGGRGARGGCNPRSRLPSRTARPGDLGHVVGGEIEAREERIAAGALAVSTVLDLDPIPPQSVLAGEHLHVVPPPDAPFLDPPLVDARAGPAGGPDAAVGEHLV